MFTSMWGGIWRSFVLGFQVLAVLYRMLQMEVKTHQMVTERELTERRRDKRTNQSKDSREDGGGGGRNTH